MLKRKIIVIVLSLCIIMSNFSVVRADVVSGTSVTAIPPVSPVTNDSNMSVNGVSCIYKETFFLQEGKSYESSDKSVAYVDEKGNLVAFKYGEVTINAVDKNGVKREYKVTITKTQGGLSVNTKEIGGGGDQGNGFLKASYLFYQDKLQMEIEIKCTNKSIKYLCNCSEPPYVKWNLIISITQVVL